MVATNQKIRRLPGFRFETLAPSREDALPRMDIALFVGFAASGPVGIPVVLESAEQFRQIFGEALPLVRDAQKSSTIYAFLAPSVRSFFRNGGKRCWIIRTARTEATTQNPLDCVTYNFFPLAGFAGVHLQKKSVELTPAFARASSAGSWSDDLQTGTAMFARIAEFFSLSDSGGNKIVEIFVPANEPVKPGELLRLNYSAKNLTLLLAVDEVEDSAEKSSPPVEVPPGKTLVKITSKRFVWLENPAAWLGSVSQLSVKMWMRSEDYFSPGNAAAYSAACKVLENDAAEKPPLLELEFDALPVSAIPVEGNLLTAEFKGNTLCLQVENIITGDFEKTKSVEIQCRAVYCRTIPGNPSINPTVERLSFELWVKRAEKSFLRIGDLAFNANHERFWGNLPTDDELYRFSNDKNLPEIPAWTQNGDAANFPLAGNGDREAFYFPIFPTVLPEIYLGAVPQNAAKIQRDGLEIFDETLFLDEKLKNTSLESLLNDGEFIRYFGSRPRPLRGIHSALVPETTVKPAFGSSPVNPSYTNFSLAEAAIISVPDAVHRGWHEEQNDGLAILSPPVFSPPLRPEWWHFQDCAKPEIKAVSEPLWGNFLDCKTRILKIPQNLRVREGNFTSARFTIIWEDSETDKSLQYILEESTVAKFQVSQTIYQGKEKSFQITRHQAGVYFYRVRAELGEIVSDWSIGLAIKIPAAENRTANSTEDYDPGVLLAVQRALLRMCAARGDLFAVLDLPEHYDKLQAVKHVATLKTTNGLISPLVGVQPFRADETKALSFGAVYHPWLLTREENFTGLRTIPASGTICGTMALRSLKRGAWVAPANEILQGVLGLAAKFPGESFLDFQDASINLVRQEPRGFLVLGSDTLSDDFELTLINVRRLLSLLRRVAVKHGAEYVFEPNNEGFRRQVQRGFNALLDLMFARGAFAGAVPKDSYQVVVDSSVNNFQSVEQGRFIVELRVAPSLPLKFITVRLVQSGGQSSITEIS